MSIPELNKTGNVLSKFILWIILPFGTTGNLLIISCFLKINFSNLRKMSVYHFLIIQLAMVDLIISATTPITISEFYEKEWLLGQFMCSYGYPSLISTLPYISCWVLVLIAYQRYRTLTRPFAYTIPKYKYAVAILSIALVCFLFYLPFTLKTRLDVTETGKVECKDGMRYFSAKEYVAYGLFLRTIDCFLPASLMCFFYRGVHKRMNKETNSFVLTEQSKKRNKQALNTLRNLILVYICCVFPGRLVVSGLHMEDNFRTDQRFYFYFVHELFSFISLLNNIINVVVYLTIIEDFRRFTLKIVTFGKM